MTTSFTILDFHALSFTKMVLSKRLKTLSITMNSHTKYLPIMFVSCNNFSQSVFFEKLNEKSFSSLYIFYIYCKNCDWFILYCFRKTSDKLISQSILLMRITKSIDFLIDFAFLVFLEILEIDELIDLLIDVFNAYIRNWYSVHIRVDWIIDYNCFVQNVRSNNQLLSRFSFTNIIDLAMG